MRKVFFALVTALLVFQPSLAEEQCRLIRVASLDMTAGASHVLVPASINGSPLTMMVDTAGYMTALTESKARELGLQVEFYPGSGFSIYGGIPIRHFVTFAGFTLGHMKAPRLTYPLLPDGFMPPDIDGILSPDFLANFDVDFDFADGKLNLFSKDHCEGKVVYWTKVPVSKLPIRRDRALHISIPVNLDGHAFRAILDTGASQTTMSLDTAEDEFDLKDDDPKLEHIPGPNGTKNARRYPFHQLTFGDVQVNNPNIILVPDNEARMGPQAPDMILGINVLRRLHLYIAYHEKYIYVSAASQH